MINLKKTLPYKSTQLAKLKLTDANSWLYAFNSNDDLKDNVLNWLKQDQLFDKGIDSEGDIIGFYSFASQVASRGKKQQGTPYTLFDTGDLYQSMFITVLVDHILINADTDKIEDQQWWREEIIGLTDENMIKLKKEYKLKVIEYARKVLLNS
jgi:hypothetical protein